LFGGTGGIVTLRTVVADRFTSSLLPHQPFSADIHGTLCLRVSLHEKSGAIAHLCNGSLLCKVPHNGGNDVRARFQIWCEIDSFEPPMEQISSRWALCSILSIHMEY